VKVSIAAVTSSWCWCEKVKRLEDVQVSDLNISPGKVHSLMAWEHKVELLLWVLKFKVSKACQDSHKILKTIKRWPDFLSHKSHLKAEEVFLIFRRKKDGREILKLSECFSKGTEIKKGHKEKKWWRISASLCIVHWVHIWEKMGLVPCSYPINFKFHWVKMS